MTQIMNWLTELLIANGVIISVLNVGPALF